MKYVKFILAIFIILPVISLTGGCGGGSGHSNSPPPTLNSINVTATITTLQVGGNETLIATGIYSDNSTKNLTTSATWSSSNNLVATVSNDAGSKGMVTAVAAGTATITAVVGSLPAKTIDITIINRPAGENVMEVTVNGSRCSANSYINKPCVSVTVCSPDLTVCQQIDDVLLDTGSYGLRVFKSALPGNMVLPQTTTGSGGSLAECVQFADQTALWGPVQIANVRLGNEPGVQMPIQVIDASFSKVPLSCGTPDSSPKDAGFTAILGVGLFPDDCGEGCASTPNNNIYFSCSGSGCSGTTVATSNQVKNPASQLHNGVIVALPQVPSAFGTSSIPGSLILGIGSEANNTPSSPPNVFTTDLAGNIATTFNGTKYDLSNTGSFIDSGSNAYFIPSSADPTHLPLCTDPLLSGWYCPATTPTPFSATITGANGTSAVVNFNVGRATDLLSSSNSIRVFDDIAGTSDFTGPLGPTNFGFDWGLPFFFGKNIFVGFEGDRGLGATGPFVAF